MEIRNYKQIFDAVCIKYPANPDERLTRYQLPSMNGNGVSLTAWKDNQCFLFEVDPYSVFSLLPAKTEISGSVAEARAAHPAFMDWLADLVNADRPEWVKTEGELLQDAVDALTEAQMHAEMLGYLRGKDKQSWSRLADHGVVVYHKSGEIEVEHGSKLDALRDLITTNRRRKARRSAAAKKAAETRARRHALRVDRAASAMLKAVDIGPLSKCYCCGKKMNDSKSIQRGIGPECWQQVLGAVEQEMVAEK